MPKKKRFGVSIPIEIAEHLDALARALEMDRSSIVEQALRNYIVDHIHYLYPHKCRGIMVVYRESEEPNVLAILEEFRDIIVSYSHHHVDTLCVEALIVSGDSSRVADLHKKLVFIGCRVRYIPLFRDIEAIIGVKRNENQGERYGVDQRDKGEPLNQDHSDNLHGKEVQT